MNQLSAETQKASDPLIGSTFAYQSHPKGAIIFLIPVLSLIHLLKHHSKLVVCMLTHPILAVGRLFYKSFRAIQNAK